MLNYNIYIIIGIVLQVALIVLAILLFSYLKQKGSNIATKEDIGQITKIIEGVKSDYAKELEEFKNNLQQALTKYQIGFSKLHIDRAEFLKELYSKLVILNEELQDKIDSLHVTEGQERSDIHNYCHKLLKDFFKFYKQRDILSTNNIDNLIDKLYKTYRVAAREMNKSSLMLERAIKEPLSDKAYHKSFDLGGEAYQKIDEQIPELLTEIKREFKKVLQNIEEDTK